MSDTTDNTIIAPRCELSSVDCLSSDRDVAVVAVAVAVAVAVEKKTVWGYLKKFFGFCSDKSVVAAVDCKLVVETGSETSATIVEEQQEESNSVVVADSSEETDPVAVSLEHDCSRNRQHSLNVAVSLETPEQIDEVKVEELVEALSAVCEEVADSVAAVVDAVCEEVADAVADAVCEEDVSSEELPSASALEPEPLPQKKRRKHRKSE